MLAKPVVCAVAAVVSLGAAPAFAEDGNRTFAQIVNTFTPGNPAACCRRLLNYEGRLAALNCLRACQD